MVLHISEELADEIKKEAQARGKSVEDFLKSAIQRQRSFGDRQKIETEQEWWMNRPLSKRAKYEGEYVAIHNKQLVDHDKNEVAFYLRVREKFGNTAVLIIPAEGPRDVHICSLRTSQQ
jgi:hypothetical protein